MKTLLKEVRSLKKDLKKIQSYRRRIFTIKEAATAYCVSYSYLQKLVNKKIIPSSRPSGKLTFIRRRDLEEYLMGSPVPTQEEQETIISDNLLTLKTKLL